MPQLDQELEVARVWVRATQCVTLIAFATSHTEKRKVKRKREIARYAELGLMAALLSMHVACAFGASPDSKDDKDDSGFLDEMPVVLSASRLAQPLDEVPAAMTVIDRQMIKESGAWDLSEVFRLVPGMYVAYHADRFYATDSTVAYHGLVTNTKSDRMQVLLDGRSVYSSLYGGVIWSDIPVLLDDVERIEIVRGPDSASFGANSFSGVINIITRHPAETQGQFASITAGNGRGEGVYRFGGKSGGLSYRVSIADRDDQGEDTNIHNPTSTTPIWMVNKYDNKRIQQFNWRSDYQLDATNSFELQAGYNGGPREMGELNDLHSDNKVARNHFEMLHWRKALDQGGELSVQVFNAVESSNGTFIDPTGIYIGVSRTQRNEVEVQHTFSPTASTRVVWGGSVRRDSAYSPYTLGVSTDYLFDTEYFYLRRLFGNAEWRVQPNLTLNLGAMLENNSYTGTNITPRIAANWHVQPEHTLRAGFSTATRTPSIYEMAVWEDAHSPSNDPNLPALRPEHVKSMELGYLGNFSDFNLDVRLFHDEYDELISTKHPEVTHNLNTGSAFSHGIEAQLKWRIDESTKLIYGVSHGKTDSNDVNKVIYSHSLPNTMQSMMLTHRFTPQWNASLMGYSVTQTHFNDTDVDVSAGRYYYIPGTLRFDGRVSYAFELGRTRAELALIMLNMADQHYFEYRHDNEVPGRITRLNLRLDF